MVERNSEQSGDDASPAAMYPLQNASFIPPVVLATTGWAVGGAVSLAIGAESIAVTVVYPVGWAIGGLTTA
ncbi:MAG: hypothetical protein ACXABY_33305, partial [Candidatus Thorarchaeota archaeon]